MNQYTIVFVDTLNKKTATELMNYLKNGWAIINASGTKYEVVYVLGK